MSRRFENRYQQIGFNRQIRLEWMIYTASLASTGCDTQTAKSNLLDYLAGQLPNSDRNVRGTLSKTITILMRTWITVPKELAALRDAGLMLLNETAPAHHIMIHWGMLSAAYPFWSVVGACVGRLLRLQDSVSASQIQQRIKEKYGERETVRRSTRYLLRSYIDWGVLKNKIQKGVYNQGEIFNVNQANMITWLIEAQLSSNAERRATIQFLSDSPAFFPFQLPPISSCQLVNASNRLEVVRYGLDEELIVLRDASDS